MASSCPTTPVRPTQTGIGIVSKQPSDALSKARVSFLRNPFKPSNPNAEHARHVGLREAVGLLTGVCIGSGIFAAPGFVIEYVGSPGAAIMVWLGCGLLSLAGGLCYAELGAALPFTGGETVYLERAFGRIWAFLYVWVSTLLARPAGIALSAIVCADYLCRLHYQAGDAPRSTRQNVAYGAICLLCFVQVLSTWLTTKLIYGLTFFKLLLVAAICLIGMADLVVLGNDTEQLALNQSFAGTSPKPSSWVLAFANCLYSFNGWNTVNAAAAEVRDPSTTIPRAIPIGILIVTISYVWINISYFIGLPIEQISGTQTVAVDFASEIVGEGFSKVITAGVALSAFATCNGSLFAGAQAVRESGRSRILPKLFASQLQICQYNPTPAAALIVQSLVSALLVLVLESFETLVRIYVWTQWVFYALTIAALVKLRYSEPELERPFRVWMIVPVVFLAVSVFTVMVLLFISPATCSVGLAVLLFGLPVYAFHSSRLKKQGVVWSSRDTGTDHLDTPLLVEEIDQADTKENEGSRKLV